MLSDAEVDNIAAVHARAAVHLASQEHSVLAVKRFTLDDPPGVYFSIRVIPEDGLLLGSGGFFVSRVDGTIRHFGSGEVLYAAAGQDVTAGFPQGGEITPAVIQHLLARAPEGGRQGPGLEAPTTDRRRHWWQFWK